MLHVSPWLYLRDENLTRTSLAGSGTDKEKFPSGDELGLDRGKNQSGPLYYMHMYHRDYYIVRLCASGQINCVTFPPGLLNSIMYYAPPDFCRKENIKTGINRATFRCRTPQFFHKKLFRGFAAFEFFMIYKKSNQKYFKLILQEY